MTADWTAEELRYLDAAPELEIAVRRPDGTLRPWVPVWVVRVDEQVYVRTWYRRTTGWFGRVLDTGRARIRVLGVTADVAVADVGAGPPELRAGIDAAYHAKYGRGGAERMVADPAAAATLRLSPERG